MELIFWIAIFIISLATLVKGADWFVESSEKIGLALRISPFIIGVTIVAVGTSFPELITSIFATLKGATEIVAANALGSNVANILLVVGLSAVVAGRLIIRKSLIDLDAPLLALSTTLFLFIMWDRIINFGEGILLISAFSVFLLYTIFHRGKEKEEEKEEEGIFRVTPEETVEVLPSRMERRKKVEPKPKPPLNLKTFIFLILGGTCLALGANYTIESVLKISALLNLPASLIAITAVAVGTSLPELVVSVKAAAQKKYEIALGNIFGSNVFNVLLVVGIPTFLKPLVIDDLTFTIGLPFLVVTTLLFVISGISRRIHIWEGLMYLIIYILFVAKLCGLF